MCSTGNLPRACGRSSSSSSTYTQRHFRREEELMASCASPSSAAHKEVHDRMVERTRDLREHQMLTDITAAQEVLRFLKDWWLGHIRGTDSQHRPYLVRKL
jgi:hemerythrin